MQYNIGFRNKRNAYIIFTTNTYSVHSKRHLSIFNKNKWEKTYETRFDLKIAID